MCEKGRYINRNCMRSLFPGFAQDFRYPRIYFNARSRRNARLRERLPGPFPNFENPLATTTIVACFSYTRQDGFRLCARHGLGQTANSIIDVYNLSMKPAAIEKEALHLPIEARAKLAQLLLESLDDLSEQDAERVWLVEAERRAREIDEGKVQLVSSEELERRVREHLR